MNTQLTHAITAVANVNEVAQRLALRPADEATRSVTVKSDNREFLDALSAAELKLQDAMDEVEGPTLTKLDYAVAALANARNAYLCTGESNRLDAADHTRQAVGHMPQARPARSDND
jgi:hypothetical protein